VKGDDEATVSGAVRAGDGLPPEGVAGIRGATHPRAAPGSPSTAARPAVSVALLTPEGRGALAVVGLAGGSAAALIDTLFAGRGGAPVVDRADGSICFGTWRPTGEDVVVVRRGPDRLEIHCHGGIAASAAVIASLERAGAGRQTWQEWLAGSGLGATAREAHETLATAGGPKAARILARQAAGALDRELDRIAVVRRNDAAAAERAARRLLAASRVGLRLLRPWRVVLSGEVNAGKSSLMNALVGHGRSIVSPHPGTTRDVVTARAVLDGWEVDLIDVAGRPNDDRTVSAVEQAGIARAAAERITADLILRVVAADAGTGSAPGEPLEPHELVVLSKCDIREAPVIPGAIATSAATGAGIDMLIAAIIDALVPEEHRDPDLLAGAVPFTRRQVEAIEAML
jgi:tRNA modification GTPase